MAQDVAVGPGELRAIGPGNLSIRLGGTWTEVGTEPEGPGTPSPGDIGLYANMLPASMTQLTGSMATGYKVNPTRNAQIGQLGTAVDLGLVPAGDVAMRAAVMSTTYVILSDSGWVEVAKETPAGRDWYDVFLPEPYQLVANTQVIFAFAFRKASDMSGYWAGLLSNGTYVPLWVGDLFSAGSGSTTIHFSNTFGSPDPQSDYRGSFRTTELP